MPRPGLRSRLLLVVLGIGALRLACVSGAGAADWPTFGGDAARTHRAAEAPELPLRRVWVHRPRHAPAPARYGTHVRPGFLPPVSYDHAYAFAVAGGQLFYASSTEGAVVCLDADSGAERWRFYANAAVRLAPTLSEGRVYFGADDGVVYCLDAGDDLPGLQDGSFGTVTRGALDGAGEWTHMYADAQQTSNSRDTRVGTEFVTQWFGPPGPERFQDRHHIPAAPVYKDGRLFVLGRNYLTVVDAYNGAYLWTREVPDSSRLIASHDANPMCVDERHVYVASGAECRVLDVASGDTVRALTGPRTDHHWGLVATYGGYLLGTNQHPDASFNNVEAPNKKPLLYEPRCGRSRPIVSDNLFAVDRSDFRRAWEYTGGAILNPSVTVGRSRIFFVESLNDAAMNAEKGRVDMADFIEQDAYLVALDLATGREEWRQPLDQKARFILYLTYADDTLLCTTTYLEDEAAQPPIAIYDVSAWDPATGRRRWRTAMNSRARVLPNTTDHNGSIQHPAAVGGRLYFNPWITHNVPICEIATGRDVSDAEFGGSRRCMPFSASERCLFFREEVCKGYDTTDGRKVALTMVSRPGCWITMLPAGGLLMMPEGSVGCICGYSMQTTIVLCPAADGPAE